MASTGPALFPGASTFPGSTTYPGGGDQPQLEVLYTTDDATVKSPAWQYAHHGLGVGYCRGYSISRGRESELQDIDAGTADIVLDARDRTFDAMGSSVLQPLNRWWIRQKFSGETHDRFFGYANRYQLSWPEQGKDSVATVSCSDELNPLNLDSLPITTPPRDSYEDLVAFLNPAAFYTFNDNPLSGVVEGSPGQILTATNSAGTPTPGVLSSTASPIVGDRNTALTLSATSLIFTTAYDAQGTESDISGVFAFTAEMWFKTDGVPAATRPLWAGPVCSGTGSQYMFTLLSTGQVRGDTSNGAAVTSVTSSNAIVPSTWYHLVLVADGGGNLVLYINGAQVGSVAFSSAVGGAGSSNVVTFGSSVGANAFSFSKAALYRGGMSATQVLTHYTAGTARGFPQQTVDARIGAVLDGVGNTAPRLLRTASRSILPRYMTGQNPLDEIRVSRQTEATDSMFFASKSGVLTFLDAAHRSSSPWNTVQIVFDDDGTDQPYTETVGEESDSFLFNVWNVTRDGGVTQTASDAASVSRFKTRPASLTGLLCVDDTAAATIATAMLAKYKDPLRLLPSIKPKMWVTDTCLAALALELGDKVEIIRRPLGGGSPIDQVAWIQKISESGKPGEFPTVELVVSPV